MRPDPELYEISLIIPINNIQETRPQAKFNRIQEAFAVSLIFKYKVNLINLSFITNNL